MTFREKYMESFTDTISQILSKVGDGSRTFTETELLLLSLYKKELLKSERKPAFQTIIETINMVLEPVSKGGKE